MKLSGIHHITAIASDPQRNLDFYCGVLGLRLVKKTVNFDDPGTYHFYFGDEGGSPGTILTFFPWPHARPGRGGSGQAVSVAFRVPPASLNFWGSRLEQFNTPAEAFETRFDGYEGLTFSDPDGLQLQLVAHPGGEGYKPWAGSPVPVEQAIRGFYGLSLSIAQPGVTNSLLQDGLGFERIGELDGLTRFQVGAGDEASYVDVLPASEPGTIAAGSVHHIAWRTPDDESQRAWQKTISNLGLFVTRVMDRRYFRSIYFREPGGVLFEIATDPPGFTLDETIDRLGTELRLPPWLEVQRANIDDMLPEVQIPAATT